MRQIRLLFLCTGNACRSQMAEGWARALAKQLPDLRDLELDIVSAGIEAHGVNPLAVQVMAEAGVDISGQSSDVLAADQGFDWVITLCGHADDHCPKLTTENRVHWDLADPAKAQGDADEVMLHFRACRDEVRRRFESWARDLSLGQLPAQTQPGFGEQDFEVLSREVSFKGFFQLHTLTLRNALYQGGWSEPYTREIFDRTEAVVVLPYDPVRDEVILIEQFRAAAMDTEPSPWLLELVAGLVEPGESYEMVAHREGIEEAGCTFQQLIPVQHYLVSPGGTNEKVVIFCGVTDSEGAGGIYGLEYENEDIRVLTVSSAEAFELMRVGRINNAASIMALQWLQLHKATLQSLTGSQ